MSLFPHVSDVLCLTRKAVSLKDDQGNQEVTEFKPVQNVIEQGDWNGIPIVKEAPAPGFNNPVNIQDVKTALDFFAVPREDLEGIQLIILSGRSPYSDEMKAGFAFGAYQVIWEEKADVDPETKKTSTKRTPKQNRLIIWAQKVDLVRFNLGGEVRQAYYYRVQPEYQGAKVDRYISVRALRREILGDTLIHEIGHNVDIWQYGRYVANSQDRAKAEKFAEAYARAHNKGKWDKPEFDSIVDGTYAQGTEAPTEESNEPQMLPSKDKVAVPPAQQPAPQLTQDEKIESQKPQSPVNVPAYGGWKR